MAGGSYGVVVFALVGADGEGAIPGFGGGLLVGVLDGDFESGERELADGLKRAWCLSWNCFVAWWGSKVRLGGVQPGRC